VYFNSQKHKRSLFQKVWEVVRRYFMDQKFADCLYLSCSTWSSVPTNTQYVREQSVGRVVEMMGFMV
jgi:hypothetical protein